jgi:hypothetical protein
MVARSSSPETEIQRPDFLLAAAITPTLYRSARIGSMDSPKPNRRWFRFSLRTMLVVVTAICIWLSYCLNWIRQRRDFVEAMYQHEGIWSTSQDPAAR